MKHWDGRERDQAIEQRLSQPDRARLAPFFEAPRPRRTQPQIHSLIGLVLALGLLVGLALLLSPADPVSSKLN